MKFFEYSSSIRSIQITHIFYKINTNPHCSSLPLLYQPHAKCSVVLYESCLVDIKVAYSACLDIIRNRFWVLKLRCYHQFRKITICYFSSIVRLATILFYSATLPNTLCYQDKVKNILM